ncbi:gliding motility-associated C-terminal domain-containing protein [Pseudoflavitalea sp. X16]|uniref:gliding motility-associated C-terminal domain-containing protein n=1 Tax=Paraflavitalea devenefica TaxID=2716334 RepID=UPI00141EA26D|nr:gliding motility-associated C-terminal domain-containing protein [Paraflavitalea devenefica]NII29782.1 gliding motility-associated C-terminal domain-containing protein [Paraflavitalea devenefica]
MAFAFPINDCATYTFKMLLGNAASQNHISDILGSTTGYSFQAGYTTVNGGQQDALLQQLDINGQVIWSKTLGTPSKNERIHRIALMPDGNIVLTGTSEDPGGTAQQPFIALSDIDGNLLWMKLLQTATNYRGVAVFVGEAEDIGMVAEDDATMLYGRFDKAGNLKWMNKVQALPQSTTIGITVGPNDYFNWFLAYTGVEAGRKVGGILTINAANGAIKESRQFGGTADNADFIFHDMQLINSRPRIIGVYAVNGAPYQLFKMSSVNGFVTLGLFETYQMPGITFDETATSVLTDRADVIAFMNTTSSNDLYMLKCIGEEAYNAAIEFTKQFTGFAGYQPSAIDRMADGGFLVACNAAGAKPLFIKTDTAGLAGGCGGTAFTVTRIIGFTYPTQSVSNTAAALVPPVMTPAYSFQPALIDTQFTCRQLTCPPKPIEDTCVYTFYRGFRSTHFADLASDLSVNANNEVMVTGSMRDDGYTPGTQHAIMVKFDAKGKLVNRKKVLLGDGAYLGKQFQMKDGNLLVMGSAGYNGKGYFTVSKLTDNLNMLWNKAWPVLDNYNDFFDLVEDADGNIYLLFQNDPDTWNEQLSLIKLDATGNLLWRKDYKPGNGFMTGTTGSMIQDDQYLYCTMSMPNSASTMLFKMEKASGNLVWARKITGPGQSIALDRNLQLLQDKLVLSGYVELTGRSVTAILFLDKNGNQLSTTSFSYNNQSISATALVTKNNELVLSGFMYDNSLSPYRGFNVFLRLDANGKLLHSKRIFAMDAGSPYNVAEATDGGLYEVGNFFYNNPYTADMYLKKYAFDGTMGNCMTESYGYLEETTTFNNTMIAFNTTTSPLTLITLPYSEEAYSLQQNRLVCSSPIVCLDPELTGPTSICSAAPVYEYRVKRNAACTAPVSWEFNTRMVKAISTSDSLLKVQFIGNGISKIYAGIFSGCRLVKDSVEVQASVVANNLELGNDTVLCTGTSIVLKANPGFVDYTWQDGSTVTNYTVTAPGKYYVTVSDACGVKLSDTLVVSAAPPIVFDIGNDTSLCVQNKLKVAAPTGFLRYTWTPDYNIDNTNSNAVTLSPEVDTMYRVVVEKTPGCFGYDSIRITVKHPLPLHIGNDTSFCAGCAATFSLGTGFQQQQWSTGSMDGSITVNSSGAYSVIATATNSCISYDTVRVTVYTNPTATLPPDAALCSGESAVLDAGNGFAQYLWQDGSTGSQQVVQDAGVYWVQVTDRNNCKASDTTAITRIIPLPTAFLPGDTVLCSFSKLNIQPLHKFSSYRWNNNAVSASITVQQPGTYWLEVQDATGCTGRDSIFVLPKQCLQGFFAPSAFSPNSDRKNDTFKPVLLGNVVKYQLLIFNRWGQIIFQSSDWNAGWDGNLAGQPQNTGAYVWRCTYQFEGAPIQQEKGTVMLVR